MIIFTKILYLIKYQKGLIMFDYENSKSKLDYLKLLEKLKQNKSKKNDKKEEQKKRLKDWDKNTKNGSFIL